MENKYVIKINQVTKQFKSVFAVKNLSLNIEKNKIYVENPQLWE
jgi:ABC-type Fe3+/spermidine/putrescine transport system ATPase subunit